MQKEWMMLNNKSCCNIRNIFSQHIRSSYRFAACISLCQRGGIWKALLTLLWFTTDCRQVCFCCLTDLLTKQTVWNSPKYTLSVPVDEGNKTYFISANCWKAFLWILWANVPEALQWMNDSSPNRCSDICVSFGYSWAFQTFQSFATDTEHC